VEPLTTERFGDLAALFNEGGDPKWCWCMWFRKPNATWSDAKPADNRADLEQLAAAALAPGLVAYRDDLCAGWVSLAPRGDYARLAKAKVLAPVDDKPVWSIVCFVVSRHARGTGVANALLDGAIEFAKAHGATILEAYPVAAERGHVPAADAFHGTQSMFERAGFAVVEVRRWNKTSPPRPIMRREL
jgi:GNAT superfamily N-acetyltransferase